MLGWSLLHYARCIMAGSGLKNCLFSAVPEWLYLTQISCLCVLFFSFIQDMFASFVRTWLVISSVSDALMCRVLNFLFLQPLPIWNLLERPWWSTLHSPLHFLLAIPSKHLPFIYICSCGALCELLAPACFVSLLTKLNILFTVESVLYPVRSVPHGQVPLVTLKSLNLLFGRGWELWELWTMPSWWLLACRRWQGELIDKFFWWLFFACLVFLSEEQADPSNFSKNSQCCIRIFLTYWRGRVLACKIYSSLSRY